MKSENENEKVLYTDGAAVTVTESALQVKKTWYNLQGITNYGFAILRPARLPWLVVIGVGVLAIIAGSVGMVPASWISEWYVGDVLFTANLLTQILGILMVMGSIGAMLSNGERYAVSITTAEGEQNVVVSKSKEYVVCIVHALNDAFFARIKSEGEGKTRQFTVSSR
jgi:hypothetical protein